MKKIINFKSISLLLIILGISLLAACNNEQVEESTEPQEQTDTEEPTTFEGENEEAPIVTMEMENDQKVIIELYPQVAPNTLDNFISLVKNGFYNRSMYNRVIQ